MHVLTPFVAKTTSPTLAVLNSHTFHVLFDWSSTGRFLKTFSSACDLNWLRFGKLKSMAKQNGKRERILNELIPFPEQIDIYKLRKFKDRHRELLNAFKNKVEIIVLNPLMNESSMLFTEAINELKARKEELSAKMNEDKLGKVFFGSVCGTIAGAAGLVAADTRVAVIGGLAGLTNAIYSALQIERAEDIFDQSGMKYLALVDKRLRIR